MQMNNIGFLHEWMLWNINTRIGWRKSKTDFFIFFLKFEVESLSYESFESEFFLKPSLGNCFYFWIVSLFFLYQHCYFNAFGLFQNGQ